MFGILTYKSPTELIEDQPEMGMNIAVRNSYDKSMSVGIAVGATVFICDNLALAGDITVMRKHTTNVLKDLEEAMITTIYRSQHNFSKIQEDAEKMKHVSISNNQAYEFLGLLYGHGVLKPRQIAHAVREWKNPSYETFKDKKDVWTLYNSVTDSLKSCPPNQIMQKHVKLHDETVERFSLS